MINLFCNFAHVKIKLKLIQKKESWQKEQS